MIFFLNPNINTIELETRKNSKIENEQSLIISSLNINQFPTFEKCQAQFFRGKPTGIYNCHGLTFASRRTCVYKTSEVYKILEEDNYIEINRNMIMPGDIVLYIDEDGDLAHSGIVISNLDSSLNIPLILSKWGCYKEAIHWENRCPYNYSHTKFYRIEE